MDNRDDQTSFIPTAGSYMNPVNQPPPSIAPPPYDPSSPSVSSVPASAPYPVNASEKVQKPFQQAENNFQIKGF